jgi:predicted MFS family arabinose efflux permease
MLAPVRKQSTAVVAPIGAQVQPAARFAALGERDFRRLLLSTISLGSGQQMELLALGWFVLQETDSAVLVGLIGATRWWGMLLAPFGGVLADRVSRRHLLVSVQSIYLSAALVIGALAVAGRLEVWLLFVIVSLGGMGRALDQTTRQTMIGDLVQREHLTGAVALVQASMNGSAVLAPVIGGAIFHRFGIAGCYLVISALAVLAVGASAAIRALPVAAGAKDESPVRSLVEGARYVSRTPVVAARLWIAAIANLFGFPITFAMMPSFARDVLGQDERGLGLLLSAAGVGALIGNLMLGMRGRIGAGGLGVVLAMLGWMGAIALFALSDWFVLSLALMVVFGMCQAVALALVAALLLTTTPEALRGRVMGVRVFAIATLPLGATAGGWLIEAAGAPATALLYAAGGALLTGAVVLGIPQLIGRKERG